MQKVLLGVAAFAMLIGLSFPFSSEAATLTQSQAASLSTAFSGLSQSLSMLSTRLANGQYSQTERANLSTALSGVSNALSGFRTVLASSSVVPNSSIAQSSQGSNVARSQTSPSVSSQSNTVTAPENSTVAQSTPSVTEETTIAQSADEAAAVAANETAAAAETAGNLFTSRGFWITVGIAALILVALALTARNSNPTRVAYASKRPEKRDEDRF